MPDAIECDRLFAWAEALIEIPSPTGDELAIARYMEGELPAAVDARLDTFDGDRANLYWRVNGGYPGPTTLYLGHLDTSYFADQRYNEVLFGTTGAAVHHSPYWVGDNLYGHGAFNMKAGLAAMLEATHILHKRRRQLHGSVVFAAVAGESEKVEVDVGLQEFRGPAFRGSGIGVRRLLDQVPLPDAAVVPGPSQMQIVNAQAGFVFVVVSLIGNAAYLRRATKAGSPLAVLTPVVDAIEDWGHNYERTHAIETGYGILSPAVTVGAVHAGWPFAPATSPGRADLYVSIRLPPTGDGANVIDALEASVQLCLASEKVHVRVVEYARNAPGTITPATHVLCRAAEATLEGVGLPAGRFPRGAADTSNDTNVLRRRGIPAIKCGPSTRCDPDDTQVSELRVTRGDVLASARFLAELPDDLAAMSV